MYIPDFRYILTHACNQTFFNPRISPQLLPILARNTIPRFSDDTKCAHSSLLIWLQTTLLETSCAWDASVSLPLAAHGMHEERLLLNRWLQSNDVCNHSRASPVPVRIFYQTCTYTLQSYLYLEKRKKKKSFKSTQISHFFLVKQQLEIENVLFLASILYRACGFNVVNIVIHLGIDAISSNYETKAQSVGPALGCYRQCTLSVPLVQYTTGGITRRCTTALLYSAIKGTSVSARLCQKFQNFCQRRRRRRKKVFKN